MAANVQVILARDVPNLGHLGELVAVRPGYARNFLVPKGLALPASPKRVALFQHQQRLVESKRRLLKGESEKRALELAKVQVTIPVKVGEQGKIFGSVTSRDVSRALAPLGFMIPHRDIKLAEALKTVGVHTLDVRLEADVAAQLKVILAPEVEMAPAEAPTAATEEVDSE